MTESQTTSQPYRPLGAIRRLFASTDTEVLISGPAHTGKSYGVCHYLQTLCEWPARILVVRKTRASLSESFIPTFEKSLPAGHPMAAKRLSPANRHSYDNPETGARIVLGSMEEPTRLYSTEWDVVWYEECTEATLDEWERLFRSLRNKQIPHPLGPHPETGEPRYLHRLIGTCNPDSPNHWLMQRVNQGMLTYFKSEHADNPSFTRDDREKLERMTGIRRKRLLEGIWCAAEGMIWENFDVSTHIVADHPRDANGLLAYDWTVVGVDWGFTNPGSMSVYGVDYDGRMYRAWQVYRKGWTIDRWIERAVELDRQWKPRAFACDAAMGSYIEQFRRAGLNAVAVSKTGAKTKGFVRLGLDMVRDRLTVQRDGKPRLMFVKGQMDEPDPSLVEEGKPTCTEEEIPSYVFRKDRVTGRIIEGEPEAAQADHGCDDLRYATVYVERYNQTGPRGPAREVQQPALPACMSDFTPCDGGELAVLSGELGPDEDD